MSNASRFWWLPLALLLSACQQAPVAPTDFTRADQIQRWEMSGKLGYRTADDGGTVEIRQVDFEQALGVIRPSTSPRTGSGRALAECNASYRSVSISLTCSECEYF